ncbi:MAG: hypothetical protein A3J07_02840 [Candidatus Doudnabacteria bacterium RIFCSPLOWO2_02_FULL_49_13]|uniref:Uncharacterized protein n=1 Tax=Candidatus Doudnabacteria bacterium RIFCSPHIGHO2_12_FULL_48_16 TaxID=1817838 RepID=A0A1F5PLD9_9BACT|nr:MAG: hypothetical protein A3B77_01480 [Candidatus Doudnabacteria bacterium RIFCSPHIGHO2_02_FULL_49_24]OGE89036.1 MAG: hypothetical protein A2760_03090 [Candidatus Doudnabacteria bacterium RIFCSPHIGHO2_01_FULL_50_67]OGE90614.1 MAG: hypothetical protein A3E29_02350 [Candidatus Doudnabacteria bacterium RIFCSPHIGHO2_12_FULL_48_16]OGE96767.1 MAG: hypothetical protein A2990_03600 [Candidatus Doudnabacteria bacterium RIFCSPLOWO2_01_FULL_49_40]OGF03007.1 MAG: hypothetical protein A3J07_02840 [Candid
MLSLVRLLRSLFYRGCTRERALTAICWGSALEPQRATESTDSVFTNDVSILRYRRVAQGRSLTETITVSIRDLGESLEFIVIGGQTVIWLRDATTDRKGRPVNHPVDQDYYLDQIYKAAHRAVKLEY